MNDPDPPSTSALELSDPVQRQTSIAETPREPPPSSPGSVADPGGAGRYFARILHQHLVDDPESRATGRPTEPRRSSTSPGFTKLSERLARKGREGAEQITEAIGGSFESILHVAYENGGSLLKFGGDALLLWFEGDGHAVRACRATILMRRVLRTVGRIEVPGAKVTLRMSQGVHSGALPFLRGRHVAPRAAAGRPGLEPPRRDGARGDRWRDPGQQRDRRVAAARCLGEAKGPGVLLKREPPGQSPMHAAATAADDAARNDRALPVAGDPRARARGRRNLRAPSGHDRLHPFRRDRRVDRAAAVPTRRPTHCTDW